MGKNKLSSCFKGRSRKQANLDGQEANQNPNEARAESQNNSEFNSEQIEKL